MHIHLVCTTGVIRVYDEDSSSTLFVTRSGSDGVLAELGVVGFLLCSLGRNGVCSLIKCDPTRDYHRSIVAHCTPNGD